MQVGMAGAARLGRGGEPDGHRAAHAVADQQRRRTLRSIQRRPQRRGVLAVGGGRQAPSAEGSYVWPGGQPRTPEHNTFP